MNHLVLDAGNHFVKWGLYSQGVLKQIDKCNRVDLVDYQPQIESLKQLSHAAIYSQVGSPLPDWIDSSWKTFNHEVPLPFKNLYQTPETLGKDRLAAAVGAYQRFPKQNLLIIDCGTCITIDFLAKEGYLGGAIVPGLTTRRNALPWSTHGTLPQIDYPTGQIWTQSLGQTTTASMMSGTDWGLICELQGWIRYYQKQYPDISIVITGGDAPFFENLLDTTIFAAPYLVLEGLDFVLSQAYVV